MIEKEEGNGERKRSIADAIFTPTLAIAFGALALGIAMGIIGRGIGAEAETKASIQKTADACNHFWIEKTDWMIEQVKTHCQCE